jgi:hypothetical protein
MTADHNKVLQGIAATQSATIAAMLVGSVPPVQTCTPTVTIGAYHGDGGEQGCSVAKGKRCSSVFAEHFEGKQEELKCPQFLSGAVTA